jgi:catechol 2,3-dioxygenase-like lactoylglutathione lyase family enzyme
MRVISGLVALLVVLIPATSMSEPVGRITGVGGVFVASKDPKALAAWYRDVLGIPVEAWGGAMLRYDAPAHPPMVVWSPYRVGSKYAAPSTREFMIDFAVDDLDAYLQRLTQKGVTIIGRSGDDADGKFAWLLDPDGTKVELWQPKAPSPAAP